MNLRRYINLDCSRALVCAGLLAVLAACSSPGGGGYYKDDGPGKRAAAEFENAPDAKPRDEPIAPRSTRPYSVFGKQYKPMTQRQPLVRTGMASWYGTKFHGRPTAIGEPYDMYAMTAAHPTLPLPSYVRVLNRYNGKTVVVRVNDRGPFLNNRIIDLSFAAAAKLGFTAQGTAAVAIEVVDPMVVTLEAMRSRRGLETAGSVYDFELITPDPALAAQPQQQPKRVSLTQAGTPAADSQIPLSETERATTDSRSPILTTAKPQPVEAIARNIPAQTKPTEPVPLASTRRANVGSLPAKPAEKPVPLSAKAPRPVADVLLPMSPARAGANAIQFVPETAPLIKVETIEGKGVRRARAERYKVPRQAPVDLALATSGKKKQEEFVVPFKDRLPKTPKGDEPKPRVYLQLGAYDTEKAAREAMTAAGVSLRWLRQPVNLLSDRGLHKLQAGPFKTSRSARAVAKRIRSESAFAPFYVFR